MNPCCTLPVEKIACNEHLQDGECCLVTDKTDAPLTENCPVAQTASSRVQLRTVRSLVRGERRWQLQNVQYYFCNDSKCPVVYFSDEDVPYFRIEDLDVRVFVKDSGDDVPVCYCFEWTHERIRKEIIETGRSTAAMEIARQVKAALCACDVKNPKGRCCLGDVISVVKAAMITLT